MVGVFQEKKGGYWFAMSALQAALQAPTSAPAYACLHLDAFPLGYFQREWAWSVPCYKCECEKHQKSSCRSENEAFDYFTFKLKCRFCQWIPVKTKKPGQFCWSWFSYEEQTHPIKWPPAENKSLLSFVPSCFLLFMVPFSFLCYFSSVSVKY